jgi:DNA-binding MarR family transcriptional regulator
MRLETDRLVDILRDTILGTVRRDGADLSARQLSLLLIATLEDGPHTVRGLALRLDISKPAITRSLDRLHDLGLAERVADPRDRRSVLVVPTDEGVAYVEDLKSMMIQAAKPVRRRVTRRAAHVHAIAAE